MLGVELPMAMATLPATLPAPPPNLKFLVALPGGSPGFPEPLSTLSMLKMRPPTPLIPVLGVVVHPRGPPLADAWASSFSWTGIEN